MVHGLPLKLFTANRRIRLTSNWDFVLARVVDIETREQYLTVLKYTLQIDPLTIGRPLAILLAREVVHIFMIYRLHCGVVVL